KAATVFLQYWNEKLPGDHGENKKTEDNFPRSTLCQEFFHPGAKKPLNGYIQRRKQYADREHHGRRSRLRNERCGNHGYHPNQSRDGRGIRQAISHTDKVERRELQRKAKQRAKGELRSKSSKQDGKQLPPDEKSEKQETKKLFVM